MEEKNAPERKRTGNIRLAPQERGLRCFDFNFLSKSRFCDILPVAEILETHPVSCAETPCRCFHKPLAEGSKGTNLAEVSN